jgi:epoxyqueuosine reductase
MLAALSPDEFRGLFQNSPIPRARYAGFLRNVAIAMGNAKQEKFRAPLEKLANSPEPLVAESVQWALSRLEGIAGSPTRPLAPS